MLPIFRFDDGRRGAANGDDVGRADEIDRGVVVARGSVATCAKRSMGIFAVQLVWCDEKFGAARRRSAWIGDRGVTLATTLRLS